jgi:hypothetical protein
LLLAWARGVVSRLAGVLVRVVELVVEGASGRVACCLAQPASSTAVNIIVTSAMRGEVGMSGSP